MTRATTHGLLLLASAVLSCSGCSGEATPASPSPTTAQVTGSGAGIWAGTVNEPVAGEGAVRLSLSDQSVGPNGAVSPGALVGTWEFALRNGERLAGRAEGYLGGSNNFGLILTPEPSQDCQSKPGSPNLVYYSLVNASVSSSRITATLNRATCAGIAFGSVTLTRQ